MRDEESLLKNPSFSSEDIHLESIEERVDRLLFERAKQPPSLSSASSHMFKKSTIQDTEPRSYQPPLHHGAYFFKQKEVSDVKKHKSLKKAVGKQEKTRLSRKQQKQEKKEAKKKRREEKRQKRLEQKQMKKQQTEQKRREKLLQKQQKKTDSAVFFVEMKKKKNKKPVQNDRSHPAYNSDIQPTSDTPTSIITKKRIGFKRPQNIKKPDENTIPSSLSKPKEPATDNASNDHMHHQHNPLFQLSDGDSEESKWLDQKIREAKILQKQRKKLGSSLSEETTPLETTKTSKKDRSHLTPAPQDIPQDVTDKHITKNDAADQKPSAQGQPLNSLPAVAKKPSSETVSSVTPTSDFEKYTERKKESVSSSVHSVLPEDAGESGEDTEQSKLSSQQVDQWLLKGSQGDAEFTEKKHASSNSGNQQNKRTAIAELQPDGVIQYADTAQQLKIQTLQKYGYREGTWDELDFYPLYEPFCYVELIREKETLDKRYFLVEIELTEEEQQLMNFIKETLQRTSIDPFKIEEKGEKQYLNEKIDFIISDYQLTMSEQSKKKIIYFLEKQFLGLDRLDNLMKDPNIEDVSCDGAQIPIFLYHRRYGSLKSNVQFESEEELSAFVIKLAQKCGKHISIAEPMLDATMPDGSRIQMTLSTEVTSKGSTFTIRKFKEDPFSPPDLIEFNTMSSEMVAYLWLAIENGINALIAGGTAAGKTSVLNAIALFIPQDSKIVSIEETREINLPHPNWIPGVARSGFGEVVGNKIVGEIDMYDLMKAALRQRPEYILVGEIRGREAYVLFQAMATGHTTYSTVHADSAQSLIHRLEGKPINIPRIMLQALDIVCIQVISRVKNKRARRCKQIIEIIDIDPTTKEILTNEVFRWDPVEDKFIYSGKSYILERIRSEKDLTREQMTNEIKNRALLLEWLNKKNIREFKKVSTLIVQYYENPKLVLDKITRES